MRADRSRRLLQVLPVVLPRFAVAPRRRLVSERDRRPQTRDVVDVMQQRGEPLLPVLPGCLTCSLDAIRRNFPALCPVVVTIGRVPLGPLASLRPLRGRLPGVVRRRPRYYQAVRLPAVVHHRRESLDFPMRLCGARRHRGTAGSPGSRTRCVRACTGSLTARGPGAPCAGGASDVAFRLPPRRRHPDVDMDFAAQYPARAFPCQRFVGRSCLCRRMTRGRCGSLRLQRFGLSSICTAPV